MLSRGLLLLTRNAKPSYELTCACSLYAAATWSVQNLVLDFLRVIVIKKNHNNIIIQISIDYGLRYNLRRITLYLVPYFFFQGISSGRLH